MQRDRLLEQSEIEELCQYVCFQLTPSGSQSFDRETLYYAVYWQVSVAFGEQLQIERIGMPRIAYFELQLRAIFDKFTEGAGKRMEIVEKVINDNLLRQYGRAA